MLTLRKNHRRVIPKVSIQGLRTTDETFVSIISSIPPLLPRFAVWFLINTK